MVIMSRRLHTTSAPLPPDESLRLNAVERYRLEGIGREAPFDRVTQLAASLFSVPIALISVVGAETQCFRGACGLDVTGTSRDVAFCAFAILDDDVMVVPDASEDPRFRTNPLVTGPPHIRFYAGAPLQVADGQAVGTLCLIDREPRKFGEQERQHLAQLARTVVDLVELRVGRFAAEEHRRALTEERELLKLTVENVSEGVALVDGDLRLTLWNEAFLELFDYPADAVKRGTNAAALMRVTAERGELGPGDPDQIVDAFVQSIRATPSRRLEVQRRDGTILDVRRKSISGNRFIMTARDITHERQMAKLKDELVSTVSHELRTPLTAISGALGLLDSGAAGTLPAKANSLVNVARRNADRLIALVNDLLDMDKLQSGKLELRLAEVDLRSLAVEAIEQNQLYADRFGVSFDADLPREPVLAQVDGGRILQVLANLISNACKFSPPETVVRVSVAREDGAARVSVADQGPGIPPEFRHRLFTRFAQQDSSPQRGHAGTGLGLAISKGIADAHGGTLELDADAPSGAVFHLRVPA